MSKGSTTRETRGSGRARRNNTIRAFLYRNSVHRGAERAALGRGKDRREHDMELRPKDPTKIRADALRMAVKKLDAGCGECAQSYVKLAKQHGATDGEIRLVLPGRELTPTYSSPIVVPKRNLWVASSLVGGVASARALSPGPWQHTLTPSNAPPNAKLPLSPAEVQSLKGVQNADPNEYGIDSNTTAGLGGMPTNFYIGEMSCGTCECSGSGCSSCPCAFNTGAANAAGPYHTYGYHLLLGPGLAPHGVGAHDWGYNQGNTAVAAWGSGAYKNYVYGQTIFADVESNGSGATNGWGTGGSGSNQAYNLDVLNGFLNAINDSALTPGLYLRPSNYNLFPNNPTTSQAFVFWVTGTVCGNLGICCPAVTESGCGCSPCDPNCSTLTPVADNWNSHAKKACFANHGSVLWQYWQSQCGACCDCSGYCYSCNGDFDYSDQDPYIDFSPVGCTPC